MLTTSKGAHVTDILAHQAAFAGRSDLLKYGSNARLLFALETRFQLSDIHSEATTCLTDGSDDKKCDLVYIDRSRSVVIVAQGFDSADVTKSQAPANKASDLNTAIGWLLNRDLADLPARIKSAAKEVREAINQKEVSTFELWYVHNLPESINVENELQTAETSLRNCLATNYGGAEISECHAVEIGTKTLEGWYQALQAPILVSAPFTIVVPGTYAMSGDGWEAFATSIPAKFLHEIYEAHGSKLFSANVRDYLGSRKSNRNVNHGIKQTAVSSPDQFWAFNNGITALVNSIERTESHDGNVELKFSGISIVNGAQTTGAIGSLTTPPSDSMFVPARFVRCSDMKTIRKIIEFNNTQNTVEPTDYRSQDPVQGRLRDEFAKIPLAKYHGGRRGGEDDLIRRPPGLLPTDTCSQALASLHGDPNIAYNRKSEIWESDSLYTKYFSQETTATHIVFAYSLLRAVESVKLELMKVDPPGLSDSETEQLTYLRRRGSTFLMVAAIGKSLEVTTGRAIPNLYRISFGPKSPDEAIALWKPIVDIAMSFSSQLESAIESGLKNSATVSSSLSTFRNLMNATKLANSAVYQPFSAAVLVRT